MSNGLFLFSNQTCESIGGKSYSFYTMYNDVTKRSKVISRALHFNDEIEVYYASPNHEINDFNVVNTDEKGFVALWRENSFGVKDKSAIHYAEFDIDFVMQKHTVLNIDDTYCDKMRAVMLDSAIVLTAYDHKTQRVFVATIVNTNLNQVELVWVNEELSLLYENASSPYISNITLTRDGTAIYLQALLRSNTLRTWAITFKPDTFMPLVQRLFDFGDSAMGYHYTYIDNETQDIFILYSENHSEGTEINDIYIAKQSIFKFKDNARSGIQKISQSNGYYTRPIMVKKDSTYYVLWEGNSLYYLGIDYDLTITVPEEILSVHKPGNIRLFPTDFLTLSAEYDEKWPENKGRGYTVEKLSF